MDMMCCCYCVYSAVDAGQLHQQAIESMLLEEQYPSLFTCHTD